jgi:glycerophosphoryl diester phosphodiesterase
VPHPFFDLPRPISIAHRGCAGEAPENTLAAFELALAQGASVLESDLHLSRDGVPVLIHDAVVDRVTSGSGAVAELSIAELQRLDAGCRFPGRGAAQPRSKLRIPSLDEVFEAFPGIRFNLEFKLSSPRLIDATLERVAAHGREAITLLTAADADAMDLLRERLGALSAPVAQGASERDVRAFLRSAAEGSEPPAGPMALQLPASADATPLITRELVAYAHASGVQVHAWTINDSAQMHELLDLGVDGIITDFPGRLAGVIAERRSAR